MSGVEGKQAADRELSTIGFPYMDLETATGVARAILNAGGVPLTRDQLGGVMDQKVTSGSFMMKLSAARMFALVEQNQGKFEITPLGFEILDKDENRQRAAKRDAFLNVPLYRKTYDDFKGKQLPPRPHGLEQAFIRFGVSSKQGQNARLVFDRSANQAGFFATGMDRLVEPIIAAAAPATPSLQDQKPWSPPTPDWLAAGQDVGPKAEKLHPFIKGLIDALPEAGTAWSPEKRVTWLRAAANNFNLMYDGDVEIVIAAKLTRPNEPAPVQQTQQPKAAAKTFQRQDLDEEIPF
jgi:hypothetical protein